MKNFNKYTIETYNKIVYHMLQSRVYTSLSNEDGRLWHLIYVFV